MIEFFSSLLFFSLDGGFGANLQPPSSQAADFKYFLTAIILLDEFVDGPPFRGLPRSGCPIFE